MQLASVVPALVKMSPSDFLKKHRETNSCDVIWVESQWNQRLVRVDMASFLDMVLAMDPNDSILVMLDMEGRVVLQ